MAIEFTLSPAIEDVRLRVRTSTDEEVRPTEEKLRHNEADRNACAGDRRTEAAGVSHAGHVLNAQEARAGTVAVGRLWGEAGGVNSAGLFTSWCCVGYAVRTSRIGRCDSWSTSSATLPNMTRLMPRRECVAITIASASASFAVATITFAA